VVQRYRCREHVNSGEPLNSFDGSDMRCSVENCERLADFRIVTRVTAASLPFRSFGLTGFTKLIVRIACIF
jgi:hypothetical protein